MWEPVWRLTQCGHRQRAWYRSCGSRFKSLSNSYLQGAMERLLRGPSLLELQDSEWWARLVVSGGGMSTLFHFSHSSVGFCPSLGQQPGQWVQRLWDPKQRVWVPMTTAKNAIAS